MVRLILAIIFPLATWAQTPLGSISGTVSAPKGVSVAGLEVSYVALPPVNHAAPRTVHTITSSTGTFTLSGVAAGSYTICAHSTVSGSILDPCVWGTAPLIVTLLAGQNVTGTTVQLQNSTALQISISDPNGLISANEGKTQGGHLIFGAWGGHFFVSASVTNSTKTSRTYQLNVPQGAQINLAMQTALYQLQDSTGTALTPGTIKPNLTISSTATTQSLTFTVVGLAKAVSTPAPQ